MENAAERRSSGEMPSPSPRLLMGSACSPGRLLDKAWWPRSADPAAELPGLVLALQGHGPPGDHGPIVHIMLGTSDWDSRPRRLRVEGELGLTDTRVVRLSWFDSLPVGLLTAIYADGHRIDLLTVPPHTDENAARAAMEQAVRPGNLDHAPDILASLAPLAGTRTQSGQENTWESEGGRLRNHEA